MNTNNLQPDLPKRALGLSPTSKSVDGFLKPAPKHSARTLPIRPAVKASAAPKPKGVLPLPGQSIHPTAQPDVSPPMIDGVISTPSSAAPLQAADSASTTHFTHNTLQPLTPTKKPFVLPKIEDEDPRQAEEPPERSQGWHDFLSVLAVLVCAMLLAGGLILFVFQSYQVDGSSMRATLEHQDHLVIWKADKTIANVTGRQYVPHRGDVVIFEEPIDAEGDFSASSKLIKRVVGLPGERVVINGTDLVVYNSQNPDGIHPDKELPYGNKIIFQEPSKVDVTLGSDEIFVSGDNRDDSFDSRMFGPLKTEQIVGKLVVRVLPLNNFKLF